MTGKGSRGEEVPTKGKKRELAAFANPLISGFGGKVIVDKLLKVRDADSNEPRQSNASTKAQSVESG